MDNWVPEFDLARKVALFLGMEVSTAEAKNRLPELMRAVENGKAAKYGAAGPRFVT